MNRLKMLIIVSVIFSGSSRNSVKNTSEEPSTGIEINHWIYNIYDSQKDIIDNKISDLQKEKIVLEQEIKDLESEIALQEQLEEENRIKEQKHGLSDEQWQILLAVVQQEGGSSYESANAVMSCIMNRVYDQRMGSDIWSVITRPGQFEAYLAGHYTKHLGNINPNVEQAVIDVLENGSSHNYLFFHATYLDYDASNGMVVGGNYYY